MNTLAIAIQRINPTTIGIAILIIFYTIGIIGVGFSGYDQFILLTPFNLLLSITVILWFHPNWSSQTLLFLLTCFLVGFGIEVIGVNTGKIFGVYEYGRVLGWKLWDTPLMIGVNWVMLVYCSGMVTNWLLPKWHFLVKAIVSATVMVILDLIIEPVAIHYDFWTWAASDIPIQNYISWWLISFILLSLFHFLHPRGQNKVARVLLALQFGFFALLNLIK